MDVHVSAMRRQARCCSCTLAAAGDGVLDHDAVVCKACRDGLVMLAQWLTATAICSADPEASREEAEGDVLGHGRQAGHATTRQAGAAVGGRWGQPTPAAAAAAATRAASWPCRPAAANLEAFRRRQQCRQQQAPQQQAQALCRRTHGESCRATRAGAAGDAADQIWIRNQPSPACSCVWSRCIDNAAEAAGWDVYWCCAPA